MHLYSASGWDLNSVSRLGLNSAGTELGLRPRIELGEADCDEEGESSGRALGSLLARADFSVPLVDTRFCTWRIATSCAWYQLGVAVCESDGDEEGKSLGGALELFEGFLLGLPLGARLGSLRGVSLEIRLGL